MTFKYSVLVYVTMLSGLCYPQSYTGCNGQSATGKLQLSISSSNASTGYVQVNGNDSRAPATPFTWNWGDGAFTPGFFPETHTYANQRNYSLQVTSHENDGTSDCAELAIPFQTANPTPSSITLVVTPNPSTFGQPVTLTTTVTPSSATGVVTFYDGTTVLESAPITTFRECETCPTIHLAPAINTIALPAGTRSLRAYYSGDTTYAGSMSTIVTQTVNAIPGKGFANAVNYPAGVTPISVVVGDFNGDGKADLAVAVANGDGVSVFLGNGNGTFQPAVNYAAGVLPTSLAVGDFNGDGNADLVVANGDGVSVLIGNGDGTFKAAVNYPAGAVPMSLAVGDFNGDGKADLAVANNDGVSVLIGNGDGTFKTAVNYSVGFLFSVAVGDFNGDGKADLAVANYGNNTVSVLLGNGNGTFQAAGSYGAGSGPFSVAVGDFNRDGITDLAVANLSSNNVSVLLGNGIGGFHPAVNYAAGSNPGFLAVGDFNGDGKADLAVANQGNLDNYTGSNVSVLLGNGDGTFQAAVNYAAGIGPVSVAVGDFNGDGRADLAVAGAEGVAVLLGLGTASPLIITTTSLPAGTVNTVYSPFTLSASGGTLPYTWTAAGLPPGLTMTSGGTITGTPTSAGTFSVSFTVKDSGSPALSATTSLPLTVTSAAGGGDVLGVSPSTVTLSNGAGSGIVAALATLTNTGSAATTFTISVATASGGNWLNATAPTNTINPNGSVGITILVDTTHLGPGPYQGTVKLHGSASTATLIANADVSGGTVSPSYVNFGLITAQKPAKQTVTVTLGGTATVDVGAQMQQGSGWLTTDALNGAIDANPIAPFNVMVDANSLTPADYTGAITLQCNPGSACSPMNVPVMFTVVTLTPQALSFTAGANNTLPAAQTAQITANSTTPASFTLSTSSTGNWLKATANQSTTPATLTVSLASLPAQDDTGTVTILQTNGPPALPPNSTYNYAVITVNYKAAPAVPLPVITQVFNAAGNQPGIAPGAFISIKGSNLTAGPMDNWNSLLTGTQLPTTIDGVTVTIGGKLAYPSYVSPTQINAAAPDAGYGSMSVTVTTPNGTSAAFSTVSTEYSPAFFLFPGNQPVATHGDYSLAAKNGTFPGTTTIPAKPGEFIILWGTGFGPTSPPVPAGAVVPSDQIYSLPALPVLILNNQACLVYGAALVAGGGPEYQVNMQVPASMPNGDWPLSVVVNGVASPTGVLLTVHN